MQRIIIRDFGPIKNCELDLAQFIVLTGAQAAGKYNSQSCLLLFVSEGNLFLVDNGKPGKVRRNIEKQFARGIFIADVL